MIKTNVKEQHTGTLADLIGDPFSRHRWVEICWVAGASIPTGQGDMSPQ